MTISVNVSKKIQALIREEYSSWDESLIVFPPIFTEPSLAGPLSVLRQTSKEVLLGEE